MLDAFTAYVESDIDYETYWGNSDNPSKTAAEYALECEMKLIDQINRCPGVPVEAADKGTAFNLAVDCLIHHKPCPDRGVTIQSKVDDLGRVYAHCEINGFKFDFDINLLKECAGKFKQPLSQFLCKAELPTRLGNVRLYGFIDEWVGDKIYDIKTTSKYKFGKFENKWQRHVYPYCVIESGLIDHIREFEFSVVVLKNPNPIIFGEIYPEVYTYDHEQSRAMLVDVVERFITWLNSRKHLITDKKIFGGVNEPDYVGYPVNAERMI